MRSNIVFQILESTFSLRSDVNTKTDLSNIDSNHWNMGSHSQEHKPKETTLVQLFSRGRHTPVRIEHVVAPHRPFILTHHDVNAFHLFLHYTSSSPALLSPWRQPTTTWSLPISWGGCAFTHHSLSLWLLGVSEIAGGPRGNCCPTAVKNRWGPQHDTICHSRN